MFPNDHKYDHKYSILIRTGHFKPTASDIRAPVQIIRAIFPRKDRLTPASHASTSHPSCTHGRIDSFELLKQAPCGPHCMISNYWRTR